LSFSRSTEECINLAKVLGLSIEESLAFWRGGFRNLSEDEFNKKYKYNVRHSYGLEGKRVNYPAKRFTPRSSKFKFLISLLVVNGSLLKINLALKIAMVALIRHSLMTTYNLLCFLSMGSRG